VTSFATFRPVRRDSVSQILVIAVPMTAGEPRVTAGRILADNQALLVGVGAERDRDRLAAERGGGTRRSRRRHTPLTLVAIRASVAMPPVGPISMPASRPARRWVSPESSTTTSAGRVLSPMMIANRRLPDSPITLRDRPSGSTAVQDTRRRHRVADES